MLIKILCLVHTLVDKTFVYANPNKRHISIQEFEKTEFAQLADEEEQG